MVCLTMCFVYGEKVSDFSNMITIEANGETFLESAVTEAKKNGELFTAWTEKKEQQIIAPINQKTKTVNIIFLYGMSYAIVPWGKNLSEDDMDGCIIGANTAEALFGSKLVQGQQICYGERILTIRGVIETPGSLVLCQSKDRDKFERITILKQDNAKTMRQMAEQFINRYGLSAHLLQFERCSSLVEWIPAKWSDFSGWKQNLRLLKQEINWTKQCQKSDAESLLLSWLQKRALFGAACFVFLIKAVFSFWKQKIIQSRKCLG